MKTWKHCSIAVLFVIFVFTCIGCSDNKLSGTWKHDTGQTIQFTGNKFEIQTGRAMGNFIGGPASQNSGTYSLSGGRIEMIFSDGTIEVYSFSRTENTLAINGRRLTK